MKFEYTTTYVPVDYNVQGCEVEDGETFKILPDLDECLNDEYSKMMEELGDEGWELVSVQQVLAGNFAKKKSYEVSGNGRWGRSFRYGYGYSLTDGFLLFWKREKS